MRPMTKMTPMVEAKKRNMVDPCFMLAGPFGLAVLRCSIQRDS